jgi:hypothetical protein
MTNRPLGQRWKAGLGRVYGLVTLRYNVPSFLCLKETARTYTNQHTASDARISHMPLILILVILLLVFGGGGYYMGPGVGYYGGGGLSLVLLIVILFLLFGRGRNRL